LRRYELIVGTKYKLKTMIQFSSTFKCVYLTISDADVITAYVEKLANLDTSVDLKCRIKLVRVLVFK